MHGLGAVADGKIIPCLMPGKRGGADPGRVLVGIEFAGDQTVELVVIIIAAVVGAEFPVVISR